MPLNILGISGPPAPSTSATQKTAVPTAQEDGLLGTIADPLIDLLKNLLPVDGPLGSLLEKFRQATAITDPKLAKDQSVVDLANVLRNLPVDPKTVTGDQLRSVIDRLGLRYEPMLQHALDQKIPVSGPQLTAQNVKAALLNFLQAKSSPEIVYQTPSGRPLGTALQPGPLLPKGSLETDLLSQLEVQARSLLREDLMGETPNGTKATPVNGEAADLPSPDELHQILRTLDADGDPKLTDAVLKLLDRRSASPVGEQETPPQPSGRAWTADELKQIATALNQPKLQQVLNPDAAASMQKAALVKFLELPAAGSAETAPIPSLLTPTDTTKAGTDFRQQANELLTAIERTQVLNSINHERGAALTFQIPFLLDGRTSTAEFYVEGRLDEARKLSPEKRHYTVVALLDLTGLGALRVDLALHHTNVSVKVTVERAETEKFANRLLPDLRKALDDQGFSVEFLGCERKTDGTAKGEVLRDSLMPADSLINLRI